MEGMGDDLVSPSSTIPCPDQAAFQLYSLCSAPSKGYFPSQILVRAETEKSLTHGCGHSL